MKTITCACLVKQKKDKLLLVRVRDNQLWYLPGGKLEEREAPKDALVRELHEELNIAVRPESVQYLYTVQGPAYGEDALVELICFAADWDGELSPCAEISDVAWVSTKKTESMAPAVVLLVERYMEKAAANGKNI